MSSCYPSPTCMPHRDSICRFLLDPSLRADWIWFGDDAGHNDISARPPFRPARGVPEKCLLFNRDRGALGEIGIDACTRVQGCLYKPVAACALGKASGVQCTQAAAGGASIAHSIRALPGTCSGIHG
jgi:hypothetical protein